MQVMQPLTDGERLRFEQCREVIRTNLRTCFEVGKALAEIRDSKLYREHWKNFQEFCRAEFDIDKSYAYRLIGSSELSPIGDKIQASSVPITNESQARELAKVPEEKRNEVLEQAAAEGPVTAASIARAAAKVAPPESPKPVIELDATGFAIPDKLVEFWNRAAEVRKLLNAVSLLRTALREAQEKDDPLWRPVASKANATTWTGLISNLDKAYTAIGLAVPYAVCPVCQGRLLDKCITCQGRGFVSEFFYKHALDSDARRVREAACQKRKDK